MGQHDGKTSSYGSYPAASTPHRRAKTLLGGAKAIAMALEAGVGEDLDQVRAAVSRMHRRTSSAGLAVLTEVDARALAQDVCTRVRERAAAGEVEVLLHGTAPRVYVEPYAFSGALHELVDNALKATKRGHPIVVDVRETDDGDVLWHVQDLGEGMSASVLAALGQPRTQRGAGLGVTLAWAVVEQHRGLLRFESTPGFGTTATMWLPRTVARGTARR